MTHQMYNLVRLETVSLDCNPLKSPPPECSASVGDLFDYCRLRYRRTREFIKAAGYQQFVVDERRLIPTARECVVGGAGYMTTEDLDAFDRAADRYVNGRVYEVEETATEVIREFVVRAPPLLFLRDDCVARHVSLVLTTAFLYLVTAQLMRYERAESVRAVMIHKLVRMLDACRVNNWVAKTDFTPNASRPWGPRKGFVRCYAITAGAHAFVAHVGPWHRAFASPHLTRVTSTAPHLSQMRCSARMRARATCCSERCCASRCTSRASLKALTRPSLPSSTRFATTAYVHVEAPNHEPPLCLLCP